MLRLRTFGGIWIEGDDGARIANPKPRRLAFLAILAGVGRRGISRNRVRAIFWPDSEDEPARHALRQTIYALRRDLGIAVVHGDAELRLDPEAITADTDDFRAAVARKDWTAVESLYEGPFAFGFALEDAPEFDRWLEEERAELARQAAQGLELLAREVEAAGDLTRAAQVWKRLTALDQTSARYATSYMSALAALGDRAAAVSHARHYTALVRRELDAEPDPSVVRLADELRTESPAGSSPAPARPVATSSPTARPPTITPEVVDAAPVGQRVVGRNWVRGGLVAAGVALAALAVAWTTRATRGEQPPLLAVGQLRDLTPPDSVWTASVLGQVLTTSLARLDVEVVANSRIIELIPTGREEIGSARTDAARRAGATEAVEGELVRTGAGLRLDLRRIDLARGTVRAGYSVSGTDRFAVIDSITALIAADLRLGPPRQALADLTPRSPVALKLYEEGLKNYYRFELGTARLFFQEALGEDTTFAMAAFYLSQATNFLDGRDPAAEARALRLSARAPDRDRLIIQAAIRGLQLDPVSRLLADTLATRFPRDPDALITAADAYQDRHMGPRERDLLERAIAIDSAAGLGGTSLCRVCDAFRNLSWRLVLADSLPAAAAIGQRHLALRPNDANPTVAMAMLEFNQGRYDAGVALLSRLKNRSITRETFWGRLLTGRLDEASDECRFNLAQSDAGLVGDFRWLCGIVYRNQGRYQDATALTFANRHPDGSPLKISLPRDVVSEYVLDLEMDRPLAAMRVLDSAAPKPSEGTPPGLFARELSWSLARRGTAAAAAREFDLVRRLADSLEIVGGRSLFGRDPRLHHFLRGLIAQSSNDHETAVDFFRRSIFSWNYGYTRANFELARSLMVLGRAGEALYPLQSALRGGWDGGNLYVTRTELHELLAQAFVAVGRRDSAAAHYTLVERAWRRADPPFAARYQAARDYLVHNGALRP